MARVDCGRPQSPALPARSRRRWELRPRPARPALRQAPVACNAHATFGFSLEPLELDVFVCPTHLIGRDTQRTAGIDLDAGRNPFLLEVDVHHLLLVHPGLNLAPGDANADRVPLIGIELTVDRRFV